MEQKLQQLLTVLNSFSKQPMENVGISGLLFIMAVSLACSLFISFLYVTCYQSRATGSQIHRAFPLLGLSITAIFICIQFSLPLSLGLLGALSIVRFRTPIKEPEEIGFIMLVTASSIACATFNLMFLGILLGVTVIALLMLTIGPRFLGRQLHDGVLLLVLPDSIYQSKGPELLKYLDTHLQKGCLESLHTADGQTSISYRFRNLPPSGLLQVQTDIKTLTDATAALNIYFSNPAGGA
jgi:hypothetical protein